MRISDWSSDVCSSDLPAASRPAGDLQGALGGQGFTVLRAVLYDARPVESLSPKGTRAISEGSIDAVTLFSPRTAGTLADLIAAAGLASACGRMAAPCLSPANGRAAGRERVCQYV